MDLKEFKKAVGKYWDDSLVDIESEHRNIVAENINKLAEINENAAYKLAKASMKILNIRGVDYYKFATFFVEKVKKERGVFAQVWVNTCIKNLDVMEVYPIELFQSVIKISEVDGKLAYAVANLFRREQGYADYEMFNSPETLEKLRDMDIDIDRFLIASIQERSDAQKVSQIIDMKKYKDAYNEKIQKFY